MLTTCPRCSFYVDDLAPRCPTCDADRSSELEIGAFLGPSIGRARRWLLVIGAMHLFDGARNLYNAATAPPWLRGVDLVRNVAIAMLALAVAHVGLWLWARRAPLPAMVTACVLFAAWTLAVSLLISPAIVLSLMWIMMMIVLAMGLGAAVDAHKARARAAAMTA